MRVRPVLAAGAAATALSVGALAPAALASGTETTTLTDIPLAGLTIVNPCQPSDVVTLVSGDLQLVMHFGTSASGGEVVSGSSNLQDVEGYDQFGTLYRETGAGTKAQIFTPTGVDAVSGVTVLRLTSQTASNPNVDEYLVFHVTINSDGYTISSVETGNATCQT